MSTITREQFRTAEQVAEEIDMSRQFVYNEARAGRLGYVRRGRLMYFRPADVDAYLTRCVCPAGAAANPADLRGSEPVPTGVVHVTTGRSYHRALDAKRLVSDHEFVPDAERDFVLAVAGVPPDLWRHDDTHVSRLVSGTGLFAFVRAGDYVVGAGPGYDWQRVMIVRAGGPDHVGRGHPS